MNNEEEYFGIQLEDWESDNEFNEEGEEIDLDFNSEDGE